MYDNANDAHRYLGSSVAYWNGEPVFVMEVGPDYMASAYKLPMNRDNGQEESFSVRAPEFNASLYKIGYANGDKHGARFWSRRPSRIQTQGLCAANLSLRGREGMFVPCGRDAFASAIRHQGFADMLVGRYPTIEEARQRLRDNPEIQCVAFDRLFAIRRHENFKNLFFLEYRGRDIAHSQSEQFILPEEFGYLRESCQPKGCLAA